VARLVIIKKEKKEGLNRERGDENAKSKALDGRRRGKYKKDTRLGGIATEGEKKRVTGGTNWRAESSS